MHGQKSIDAQIMDLADEIAYAAHDLEDALSFRAISIGEMLHEFYISNEYKDAYDYFKKIVDEAHEDALKSKTHDTSEEYATVLKKGLTSRIVNKLCEDITFKDSELHYASLGKLATGLKNLLYKAIMRKKDVLLYERKGEKILRGLFAVYADRTYNKDMQLLPPELRVKGCPDNRPIIDYIAGMMDSFAEHEYAKYFGTSELNKYHFNRQS